MTKTKPAHTIDDLLSSLRKAHAKGHDRLTLSWEQTLNPVVLRHLLDYGYVTQDGDSIHVDHMSLWAPFARVPACYRKAAFRTIWDWNQLPPVDHQGCLDWTIEGRPCWLKIKNNHISMTTFTPTGLTPLDAVLAGCCLILAGSDPSIVPRVPLLVAQQFQDPRLEPQTRGIQHARTLHPMFHLARDWMVAIAQSGSIETKHPLILNLSQRQRTDIAGLTRTFCQESKTGLNLHRIGSDGLVVVTRAQGGVEGHWLLELERHLQDQTGLLLQVFLQPKQDLNAIRLRGVTS